MFTNCQSSIGHQLPLSCPDSPSRSIPPRPTAFAGVVEGDLSAVEAYKSSGGDIARQLTADEVRLLNRPSAFDDGFTLVHLAIRFQRQDMLAILLTEVRSKRWIIPILLYYM